MPIKPPVPAKTQGPTGRIDQGDPSVTSWLGWTVNVTGARDWADHTLHYIEGWFSKSMAPGTVGRSPEGVPTAIGRAAPKPSVQGDVKKEQLKKVFPQAKDDFLQQVADELNPDLKKYGLDSVLRRAHFFAQVRQEGGPALKGKVESLSYSSAGLKGPFKYYRLHPAEADADAYVRDPKNSKLFTKDADQQAIANKAYAGRNGNGNAASGDGWKYRGRGLIQTTGRSNYAAVSASYKRIYGGDVDFVANPELMESFPYTVRSAVAFWMMSGLDKVADKGDKPENVDAVTSIVDNGTSTYADRRKNFTEAYNAFK